MNKLDNLHAWRIFVTLAETGRFQTTADLFETEVSTVSRHLSSLETALGRALIVRKTAPLVLTPAGKQCYALMRDVLERHQAALDALLAQNNSLEGSIRLSAAQGLSAGHMVGLILEFNRFYPKVTFQLTGSGTVQDLVDNTADIACITGDHPHAGIVCLPRGRVCFAAIASPDYVRRHGCPREPSELASHTVIQFDGVHRRPFTEMRRGDEVQKIVAGRWIRSSDILTVKTSVLNGQAICTDMPLPLCRDELESGALVRVLPGWKLPSLPTYIAIPAALLHSRRHRVFAYWLRDKIATIEMRSDCAPPKAKPPRSAVSGEA